MIWNGLELPDKPRFINGCAKSVALAEAMEKAGWDSWTCDIQPSEGWHKHIQDDILNHLDDGWDMGIFHPDCTYLANSGVRWLNENCSRTGELYKERWEKMVKACEFFNKLLNTKIPLICVENPIQHKYARQFIRQYDQIIQPYQFGEDASKATCLWLKGLPKLKSTKYIEPHYCCPCGGYPFEYALGKYGCPNCGGEHIARLVWGNQTPSGQNNEPPGINQKANRARTYQGIADAMADQWGVRMKFNDENKVIIDTMNQTEARAFVLFLKSEISRHKMDIDNARDLIYDVISKFHLDNMLEDE